MRRKEMARKLTEALNAASLDADARKRYADQLAECRRELAQTRKPQVFVSGTHGGSMTATLALDAYCALNVTERAAVDLWLLNAGGNPANSTAIRRNGDAWEVHAYLDRRKSTMQAWYPLQPKSAFPIDLTEDTTA